MLNNGEGDKIEFITKINTIIVKKLMTLVICNIDGIIMCQYKLQKYTYRLQMVASVMSMQLLWLHAFSKISIYLLGLQFCDKVFAF